MSKAVQDKCKHVRVINGDVYYRTHGVLIATRESTSLKDVRLQTLVRWARNERNRLASHKAPEAASAVHCAISRRLPGYFHKRQVEKQLQLVAEDKKPINFKTHIGVEIEFLSPESKHSILKAFAEAGLAKHVAYHSDSSVSGDDAECDGSCRESCECSYCGETHYCVDEAACRRRSRWHNRIYWVVDDAHPEGHCQGHSCDGYDDHPDYECQCECTCGGSLEGHELCVIAERHAIYGVIERVCSVLNDRLEATVNKTCGLHVHLDVRRRAAGAVYNRLFSALPFLCAVVPGSRLRNTYCKINELEFEDHCEEESRYFALNTQSLDEHGTIEVRLHSGTTDAVKINNWIRLLQFFAYDRKKAQAVQSFAQLISQGLPFETAAYFATRYQKFGETRSKGWKPVNESVSQAAQSFSEAESEAA